MGPPFVQSTLITNHRVLGFSQQAPFAAPGMQQVPQYAAMGYGQQYPPYMPHYGVQNAYFPQHPGGYGGYPAQVSISSHLY